MKPKLNISFSGGRTSAYMTKKIIDNWSDKYDFIVVFSNTGLEHSKTLDFVNNCDKNFGFDTTWIEAVFTHDARIGVRHKIVDYLTASREGEPFEEYIRKHGIPSVSHKNCSSRLKLDAMNSYRKTVDSLDSPVTIGIRSDETRRVSPMATQNNILYPLVDTWPTDKQDVLDWWEDQEFDLGIDEFEGNCLGCYKKSLVKHFKQIEKDPSAYDFHRRMELFYGDLKATSGRRVFFRNHMSTNDLFAAYEQQKDQPKRRVIDIYEDGGCSESCEVYSTEELPDWLK